MGVCADGEQKYDPWFGKVGPPALLMLRSAAGHDDGAAHPNAAGGHGQRRGSQEAVPQVEHAGAPRLQGDPGEGAHRQGQAEDDIKAGGRAAPRQPCACRPARPTGLQHQRLNGSLCGAEDSVKYHPLDLCMYIIIYSRAPAMVTSLKQVSTTMPMPRSLTLSAGDAAAGQCRLPQRRQIIQPADIEDAYSATSRIQRPQLSLAALPLPLSETGMCPDGVRRCPLQPPDCRGAVSSNCPSSCSCMLLPATAPRRLDYERKGQKVRLKQLLQTVYYLALHLGCCIFILRPSSTGGCRNI